jgi:hypothetical protein
MEMLLIAAVIAAVATLGAITVKQRKPEAPTQRSKAVPDQLDRNDFNEPNKPWLVTLFTSDTCDSCAGMVPKVEVLSSDTVAVAVLSYQRAKPIHDRYHVDSVPMTLLADADGVVQKSFVGPVSATDLWAAVAELREPGSTPPPEAHRPVHDH